MQTFIFYFKMYALNTKHSQQRFSEVYLSGLVMWVIMADAGTYVCYIFSFFYNDDFNGESIFFKKSQKVIKRNSLNLPLPLLANLPRSNLLLFQDDFSTSNHSSISGSSVEVLMEIADSFYSKVMSYDHSFIEEVDISRLRSLKNISSTRNEDDVVLEPCIPRERVCIVHPKGVKDEYFHFYDGVLDNFKIHLPFTDFESDLLRTLNISPS
ncbi:hypothetical protein KIW84_064412 [Lathyrus oleraceus]|uniref:Uncharacterized protein n=1 Tax=Pisum sativum TaxID=3888 RepID=A0A9D4WCH3_PEA|nr:hypothetical protein KIW84_064412 [Pisum sativum]